MILKSSFLVRFVVVRPSSSSCRFVVSLFFFFFRVLFAQNLFARFQITNFFVCMYLKSVVRDEEMCGFVVLFLLRLLLLLLCLLL